MYPPQDQPNPYGYQGQQGYEQQFQQPYHQHGYPPPPQQQEQPRAGYPGQGPKPGHGGRSKGGEAKRPQAQAKSRNPPSKQQQRAPQQQPKQQPKQQAARANRQPKEVSEISLCIKYALFFANFFFWLAGCFCMAAGVWALSDRGSLATLDTFTSLSPLVDPVLWMISIGGIIFALATFGCIGALRENIILLKVYSGLLGLILCLEIGGGIAIYFYRTEIEVKFREALSDDVITNYRNNEDFQDIVDGLQSGLYCCGVNEYNDWDFNEYFNCTEKMVGNNPNLEACGVPFSCCIKDPESEVINTQCGYDIRSKQENEIRSVIYTTGCATAFKEWILINLVVIAIVAGVILLVEIFGFCFATSLVSDIKRQKARWRN